MVTAAASDNLLVYILQRVKKDNRLKSNGYDRNRVVVFAFFGFAGCLLHVVNHALFKGLLFMGAGSVAHGAHTREIDHLGGLLKRMPWTAGTFLVGAVAISGLPPLNGFVSEFLIYLGSFKGAASIGGGSAVAPFIYALF